MRRYVAPLALTAAVALSGGCTDQPTVPPVAPVGSPVDPAASRRNPQVARACADATRINNESTRAFTAAVDRAVTAGSRGDEPARGAALGEVRSAFGSWSARLRTLAADTPDPQVRATLTQYAGAVTATVARVRTADDLDQLYTFTEKELDIAASQLATVCG